MPAETSARTVGQSKTTASDFFRLEVYLSAKSCRAISPSCSIVDVAVKAGSVVSGMCARIKNDAHCGGRTLLEVIRERGAFTPPHLLVLGEFFYAKSLSIALFPISVSLRAFPRNYTLGLGFSGDTQCASMCVWIIASVSHTRAAKRLVKNPSRLQGHSSGFSTFGLLQYFVTHTHKCSHTFQSFLISRERGCQFGLCRFHTSTLETVCSRCLLE